ncbi:unnamed protein product [Rotaria socialis]|uniref:Uncharacterized protein n=1 Tax=Rotaria socialis TaxID=392032 RepID=A0A818USN5_9BILA|nr:unnamed protein product [Rotaria socialis]CAF4488085.1 unnamed protein product [Rotaria socialis]
MNLLVGSGTATNNDVIRKAFELLINQHELIPNIMLKLLNKECNLFNNTKLIHPITYEQSRKELTEARENPSAIYTISPADLWILHHCENNECYLDIRSDANKHQIDLARMQINLSQ